MGEKTLNRCQVDVVYHANGRVTLFCEELGMRQVVRDGRWTQDDRLVPVARAAFRKRCEREKKRIGEQNVRHDQHAL